MKKMGPNHGFKKIGAIETVRKLKKNNNTVVVR